MAIVQIKLAALSFAAITLLACGKVTVKAKDDLPMPPPKKDESAKVEQKALRIVARYPAKQEVNSVKSRGVTRYRLQLPLTQVQIEDAQKENELVIEFTDKIVRKEPLGKCNFTASLLYRPKGESALKLAGVESDEDVKNGSSCAVVFDQAAVKGIDMEFTWAERGYDVLSFSGKPQ